eukprot:2944662-Pyramimonas_sp.AAC.1
MAFVADDEEVCRGFWANIFAAPSGPNADLWRRLGEAFQATDRHPGDLAALQVPPHLEAQEVVERGLAGPLIAGNCFVDHLAGVAAKVFGVPGSQRARLLQVEADA